MDDRITGVMVYYYFLCRRKLWYFCHDINMENENENVMIGRILDETSYKRDDKHVNIDNVINIDFIREHKEIHKVLFVLFEAAGRYSIESKDRLSIA